MTGKADVRAIRTFRANIGSIHQLMRFDELVLDFVTAPLRRLSERQDTAGITNQRHRPDRIVKALENIKANESLRPYYQAMYNQCLVLLVSYFASASRDLYIDAIAAAVDAGSVAAVLDVEVRLTPRNLRESPLSASYLLAESLANGKEVSFQDMQSINRAFRRFFPAVPDRGQMINDIIIGQGCRHAIVHAGAVADKRLITQLNGAFPRLVKPSLQEGDAISFSRIEVRAVAKEMLKYLRNVADAVEATGSRLPRMEAV